mgnify:CR=1 FL=1
MSKYIFETKMEVRDYECDIEGIVNNANYFTTWSIPATSSYRSVASVSPRCTARAWMQWWLA